MNLRTLLAILLPVLLLSIPPALEAATMERPYAVYHFPDDRFVAEADSTIEKIRTRLQARLGDTLDYKPDIFVVEDQQTFDSLLLGRLPHWGAAAALPALHRIVIKSPGVFNIEKSFSDLLAHEYSHLALAARTGIRPPPRWFDEGLAMWMSTEWGWGDNLAISKAAVFGQLFDLHDLELLNRFNADQAHVAYAQSYLTVRYLYEGYSDRAVGIFLDSIAAGADIDSALIASTGSNYAEFGEEVKQEIQRRYNVATLFMDTIYLWLGLAIVVIIAGIMRIRRRRKYYREWDKQERYQSTDFDYGDPDNPEATDDDEPWRS